MCSGIRYATSYQLSFLLLLKTATHIEQNPKQQMGPQGVSPSLLQWLLRAAKSQAAQCLLAIMNEEGFGKEFCPLPRLMKTGSPQQHCPPRNSARALAFVTLRGLYDSLLYRAQ